LRRRSAKARPTIGWGLVGEVKNGYTEFEKKKWGLKTGAASVPPEKAWKGRAENA